MGSRRYTAHVRLGPETGRRLVYVFGSNRRGAHGRGSASYARRHHGAKPGQGEGLAGHSYALPTKDADIRTLPLDAVQTHVGRFLAFAVAHPEMDFLSHRSAVG